MRTRRLSSLVSWRATQVTACLPALLSMSSPVGAIQSASEQPPIQRLIVRFNAEAVALPDVAREEASGSSAGARGVDVPLQAMEIQDPSLLALLESIRTTYFRTVAPAWRDLPDEQENHRGEVVSLIDFTDVYVLSFESPGLTEFPADLRDHPTVAYLELPRSFTLGGVADPQTFPDDDDYPIQWHLHSDDVTYQGEDCLDDLDVNAPEAWQLAQGAGTKIAVIDGGAQSGHYDLSGIFDTSLSDGFDADWDTSPCLHGTATAGLVSAVGDNGIGVASVSNTPGQTDDPLVVLRASTTGSCLAIFPDEGADAFAYVGGTPYPQILVTSNSWVSDACFDPSPGSEPAYSPTLRDAARNLFLLDVATFACAGNGSSVCQTSLGAEACPSTRCWPFPAAFDDYAMGVRGITCVGSAPPPNSAQGRGFWVDLTAPSKVWTTANAHGYTNFNGCSAATPIAASTGALLLEHTPDLFNEGVFALLETAATDSGAPGMDPIFGAGLLRADVALSLLEEPNDLIHEKSHEFTSSLVDERAQWFKNLAGTSNPEEWELRWVEVYELRVDAPFPDNAPEWNPIVAVWPRGKLTTGQRNDDSLDVRFWAGHSVVDESTVTPQGCELVSYTYKIFNDSGTQFHCWWPLALSQTLSCGATARPRFDYTYIVDTSESRAAPPSSGPDLLVRRVSNTS